MLKVALSAAAVVVAASTAMATNIDLGIGAAPAGVGSSRLREAGSGTNRTPGPTVAMKRSERGEVVAPLGVSRLTVREPAWPDT